MEQFYTNIRDLEKGTRDGVFLVLSDNIKGLFSFGVKVRTRGSYSHFMWKTPEGFASQDWYFRMFPVSHYAGCTLKFVYNPDWTESQKAILLSKIQEDIDKPWYKSFYDIPAILGQLIGWDWLQFRNAMICSERIAYLRLIDSEVDEWMKTEHTPTPTDVNLFTKARQDKFRVFARYSPD